MISKAEYFYAKKKKDDLVLTITSFETTSKVYAMWTKWLRMSPTEKQDLIAKWEVYYAKCRDSYYGKRFWEARKHFADWIRTGDGASKAKLNEIVNEVKTSNVTFITTPSSIDPRELEKRLQGYFDLKKKQKEYQDIFEEYEDAYEPKKSKGSESL